MQNHQLRQTVSVLRLSTLLLSLSLISGCSILPTFGSRTQPIEIQKKAVERTQLDLPLPPPVKAREMQWFVVTKENIDQVWKKLEEDKVDLVLFGLTDDGYQELAMTIAELRNHVATQRAIIIKYKEYYEPPKTPDSK
jgi:hypothetical protein